jgi:hypothetical protein
MNSNREIVGFGLILCAVCLFGWQAYAYLRTSFWNPISVITMLEVMKVVWALHPNDWLGLYKILKEIPLSITLFIVGLCVMAF